MGESSLKNEFNKAYMQILAEKKIKNSEAARRLGISKQAFQNRLQPSRNITEKSMREMANSLGYDMIITCQLVPKEENK
ncbi:MAG: hypothetical protein KH230_09835 [Enterocloster asparagiformis]|nr:hypothetical protein [Enterocloster asparagiformis]